MNALIEVRPEWADPDAFEAARAKIIALGLRSGCTLEELFALNDAEIILGLWKAADAIENDLWE
jgi:hypothetical protein